jgi:hypothetical protein
MAEGGFLAWNRQTIDSHRGPAASYSNLSLPQKPPKGKEWFHDEDTKEWRLVDEQEVVVVVDAVIVNDDYDLLNPNTGVLEHKIQPTDTFQGLCLRYKVTPTELRQANGGFSGTNLHLCPNPLTIPRKMGAVHAIPVVDSTEVTPQHQMRLLKKACPQLSQTETKCYLELNDWNLKEALANAKEDGF